VENKEREYTVGFVYSIVAHVVLGVIVAFQGVGLGSDFGNPIVYSVTIERGDKVGGIAQAPKTEKAQIAPPKAVQQPVKRDTPSPTPPPAPEKKVEPEVKAEPPEEAEVSLAEQTPTPAPTPTPTPAPTPASTPTPAPKATPAPTPRATPAPKATPARTPQPKAKQLSSAEIDKRLQEAVQRYAGESTDAGGKGFGSVGGGERGGYGGGQLRPPEFFDYRNLLENYVKSGWRWHDSTSTLSARVCFRVREDGAVSQVQLCGSSGNNTFDSSAIRAVQKANPVPAPPESVYHYFREVRMIFSPSDF